MTSELALVFPDRFTKTNRVRLFGPEKVFTRGIDGTKVLGEPDSTSLLALQGEFARWALVLLLRETSGVPLHWSPELGLEGTRVTVAATGPNGFNMTLALDRSTCQPTSVTYDRPPNLGDEPTARAAGTRFIERYDLEDYRMFDGIRLPTRIQMVSNGTPLFVWSITSASVGASPRGRD